jgi:hypothetical protein
MALIAGDRTGQAKPTVIPNAHGVTPGPITNQWIDASSALVTALSGRRLRRAEVARHHVECF